MYSINSLTLIQTANTGNSAFSNPDYYQDAFVEHFEICSNLTLEEVFISVKKGTQNGIINLFTLEKK